MCLTVIGGPRSSRLDELQWSGRDVLRWKHWGVVIRFFEGLHLALKHRSISIRPGSIQPLNEIGANLNQENETQKVHLTADHGSCAFILLFECVQNMEQKVTPTDRHVSSLWRRNPDASLRRGLHTNLSARLGSRWSVLEGKSKPAGSWLCSVMN